MWWFILGLWIGAMFGYFIAFLMFVSSDSSRREEQIFRDYEEMLNENNI